MKPSFVITVTVNGSEKSQVWDSEFPLALGFPFHWILEKNNSELVIRNIHTPENEIVTDAVVRVHAEDITKEISLDLPLSFEQLGIPVNLKIRNRRDLEGQIHLPELSNQAFSRNNAFLDKDLIKKGLSFTFISLSLFSMLTWFWPKPQSEALIPVQYTKIVFSSHELKEEKEESTGQKIVSKNQASVRAFRAKALQNAVSGLLKGGMTKLLSESEFFLGRNTYAQTQKILDKKSTMKHPTAPLISNSNYKQVQVASLGNMGGIGYHHGDHASVSGQGKSFVSLDSLMSSVEEGLTKDEVGEVIHRHLSEIRYCYESAMIHSPDLEGKLIINFSINHSGSIHTASIKSSTLSDSRVDDCVLRRLVTWKFPSPKGGIDVAVSYPFIFKTLER